MPKPFVRIVVFIVVLAIGAAAVWLRSSRERERQRKIQETARQLREIAEQIQKYSGPSEFPRTVTTRQAATQFVGPKQYQPFHGTNPDSVYIPATNPATVPADDSRYLLPNDDK